MIEELERLDDLGAEMVRRARAAGVLLIWRTQALTRRHVVVREGTAESVSHTSFSGHGVQVMTPGGHSALASRDDFSPEPAVDLLQRTIEIAARGSDLGLQRDSPLELPSRQAVEVPETVASHDRIDLPRVTRRLAELEREIGAAVPGVTLLISARFEVDAWRIFRSDGSDVLFAMPRCNLGLRATSAGAGARHGVSASVFNCDAGLLDDEITLTRFRKRALTAARLARTLPDAPAFSAGSYPLVIDYALAKGLAHEAFGHASEADGFRSSILADGGRFRSGETVGAEHVSIIDEPVAADHAWQPYSANGLPRSAVRIVTHGRLGEALSDPWSAGPAGVPLSGAARAESFRHAPQPRMTNIRIEVDDPLPAPGEFEDYGPDEVAALLSDAGVFRRHPRVVFLSGYSGGQVNTATGDFVFNCKAIYELGGETRSLYKPAIFSGSMFGALGAIREAFGPLRLDATGYCGKWGQSVPSSGGSHYFLALEPDPTVRLGGR